MSQQIIMGGPDEPPTGKLNRKTTIFLVGIIVLLAGTSEWLAYVVATPAPSIGATVEPGSLFRDCTYTFYIDGTTYLATKGDGSGNKYSGSVFSTVFQSAVTNGGSGAYCLTAGQYTLTVRLLTASGITLKGEDRKSVVLVDTTTSKLPGNTLYGAAISNSGYSLTYDQNTNIHFEHFTVKPNTNNVGIALGGVTGADINDVFVDLSIGYKAVDFEASKNILVTNTRVNNPANLGYYNYGIGTGLAGFTPKGNIGIIISGCSIEGITGDSFIVNAGDDQVDIGNCIATPRINTSVGLFDAFVDIEGQTGQPVGSVIIHDSIFVGASDATAAPNGILVTINGLAQFSRITVSHNQFVGNGASQAGSIVAFGPSATAGNGIYVLDGNIFDGINIVSNTASPVSAKFLLANNIFNLIAGNSVVVNGAGSSSNIIARDNILMKGLMVAGTINGTTIITHNQGYNPIGAATNFVCATWFCPWGTTSTVAASTTYIVSGTDLYLTSSGGTGVNLVIQDPQGNTVYNPGATLSVPFWVPIGYKISFGAFSVAPTVTVKFN